MKTESVIDFLLNIEQAPNESILANIYLKSLLSKIDSLYTLHQISHADRLFNRRRQYLDTRQIIRVSAENDIGDLGRLFIKALPYFNEQILDFFIFKIERRRHLIYAVSRHLNIPPTNKTQFDQIANKIYVFGM